MYLGNIVSMFVSMGKTEEILRDWDLKTLEIG